MAFGKCPLVLPVTKIASEKKEVPAELLFGLYISQFCILLSPGHSDVIPSRFHLCTASFLPLLVSIRQSIRGIVGA